MWVFSLHLCTCLLRPLGVGLYYVSGYADTTSREVWPGWATVVAFLVRCFFVRLLAYAMSGYAGPYHGALSGPWWVVAFWPLCANHALCDAGGWWRCRRELARPVRPSVVLLVYLVQFG